MPVRNCRLLCYIWLSHHNGTYRVHFDIRVLVVRRILLPMLTLLAKSAKPLCFKKLNATESRHSYRCRKGRRVDFLIECCDRSAKENRRMLRGTMSMVCETGSSETVNLIVATHGDSSHTHCKETAEPASENSLRRPSLTSNSSRRSLNEL